MPAHHLAALKHLEHRISIAGLDLLTALSRKVPLFICQRSVQTYRNVKRLAEGLGVKAVKVIANKIRNEEDEKFVRSKIPKEDFLGCIHYDAEVIEADREGTSPYGFSKAATDEIRQIKETFDAMSM